MQGGTPVINLWKIRNYEDRKRAPANFTVLTQQDVFCLTAGHTANAREQGITPTCPLPEGTDTNTLPCGPETALSPTLPSWPASLEPRGAPAQAGKAVLSLSAPLGTSTHQERKGPGASWQAGARVWIRATYPGQPLLCIPSTFQGEGKGCARGLPWPSSG